MLFIKLFLSYGLAVFLVRGDAVPCVSRKFDQDSTVCVCNSTYCDAPGIEGGGLLWTYFNTFTTTKDGLRLYRDLGTFDDQVTPNKYVFTVGNNTRQMILGFGGAFTDAATMTMNSLSPQTRHRLIASYFEQNGLEYTMGRIPMASNEFSNRVYSYDDVADDFELTNFKLPDEDIKFKLPAIRDAVRASKRNVTLFGTPWSSPSWMKTNGNMSGPGTIKDGEQFLNTWAKYFVQFIKRYTELGVNIWAMTVQNEPSDGFKENFPYQCLGWTAETQRDFISKFLGPALKDNGLDYVKLIILDDQRTFLPSWPGVVLNDPSVAPYVSGIAVHWYADDNVSTNVLDETYFDFGDEYFLLNTEAAIRDEFDKSNTVRLGDWQRGERYFIDILQDLKHGVSGWVDSNLALDMNGGPSWAGNEADSAVIVNTDKDEFYKQPMFYAMGHFSKFVRPGSKMLEYSTNLPNDSDLKAIFFTRLDDSIAANFVNTNENEIYNITITDYRVPGYLNYQIFPKTFITFIWYRI
ncbi:hypothetical protein ACF0H5_004653 [Mactra antiquata]